MQKLKTIVTCLFSILMSGIISAQVFPNLGGQRAGISALTFLKNDLSPRSASMGGASVSLPGDAFSMAVNPAGNASLRFPSLAISSTTNASGIVQSFLGFSLPTKSAGVWMGSLNYLSSGLQKQRTEFQPFGDGTLYSSDAFKAGIGYSRALSKMFSCGMNLNYVREQLGPYSANAVTADLGFLYKTDWKDLSFAVGFQHFGGTSTLNGSALAVNYNRDQAATEGYGAPTMFSMGVSMMAYRNERHKVLAAAQLNHPNDNAENIRLGIQYTFDSLFHLRLGYKVNVIGENLTAGAGIQTRMGAFPMSIEYSLVPNSFIGMIHSLGITIGFIRPGNFEENRQTATGVPVLGKLIRSRKKTREKIEIDSLFIRVIDRPDFRQQLPETHRPLGIVQETAPNVPEIKGEQRIVKPAKSTPAGKLVKSAPPKVKPAKSARAAKADQPAPPKAKIAKKKPRERAEKQRSIWQKPFLKSWTEKQWKGFMEQRAVPSRKK